MNDGDAARRLARRSGLTLAPGAGVAAQPATVWADDLSPAGGRSGEFVETPVGPSAAAPAAAAAPTPTASATPAGSAAFVEQPAGAASAATAPTNPTGWGPLGFLSTASRSSNLLADMWGLRPLLSKYGMTPTAVENSELFGNVSGGARQGFESNGLTTATLQMDTQRAFGLNFGLFNASALQIHGGNLSPAK
jgi:porin